MYGDFRQYEPGEKVYIPEGEKCVDVCHSFGVKNVATVGSSNVLGTKERNLLHFLKVLTLLFCRTMISRGEKLTNEIISALKESANSIKVIVTGPEPGKGRCSRLLSEWRHIAAVGGNGAKDSSSTESR